MAKSVSTHSKEASMATSVSALRRSFPVNCVVWNKAPSMTRPVDAIVADHYRASNGEIFLKLWDGVTHDAFWIAPPAYCQRKPLQVTLSDAVRDRRAWAIARDAAGKGGTPDAFAMAHARKHGSAVLIEPSDDGVMWVKVDGRLKHKNLGPVAWAHSIAA